MQITTLIQTSDPNYPYTSAQAAAQVLAALGGSTGANDASTARVEKFRTVFIVNVNLADDDNMPYTAAQAATQALAALAGDPTKDYCTVSLSMPMANGRAGVPLA